MTLRRRNTSTTNRKDTNLIVLIICIPLLLCWIAVTLLCLFRAPSIADSRETFVGFIRRPPSSLVEREDASNLQQKKDAHDKQLGTQQKKDAHDKQLGTLVGREETSVFQQVEDADDNNRGSDTLSEDAVVLIVPFIEEKEAQILMDHLTKLPTDEKKNLHVMFVREANSTNPYLRVARLMNVGLSHASNVYSHNNSTCFVTHDVNLLPNVTTIRYGDSCEVPTQLCYEQSCYADGLPYPEYAGGVVSASRKDWLQINGYTGSTYDWGGEGDDLYWRFRQNGLLDLTHIGASSEWMLRQHDVGKGKCECSATSRRPFGSYLDKHKVGDRIRRMSVKKSTEWKTSGLNSLAYEVQGIVSQRQNGILTTVMDVVEPTPVVDDGLQDHRNDSKENRQSVVLLFAYRDRKAHYERMMEHIHQLRRKAAGQWDLHVYVVEQMNNDLFRKGWLLNIGFHEIAKRFDPNTTCVVQHDIDLLPNLDTVDYGRCEIPTQICTEIPCLGRTFPYQGSCAGGVVAARLTDWQRINGYTIQAYGWGAEDDDIYFRFRANSLLPEPKKPSKFPPMKRPEEDFGYCDCVLDDVDHTPRQKHPNIYNAMMLKLKRMRRNSTEWKLDGYENTKYSVVNSFQDSYGSSWIQANYSSASEWTPPVSKLDPNGPKPVILMSIGRSGSTGIFHALGNLTGETIFGEEYVGRSPKETSSFFEKYQFDDGQWLVDHLADLQKKHPNAGIVGFKWKPYINSLYLPGAVQALQRASKTDPPIKFIHSFRNPLDVIISEAKHDASNHSLGWYCAAGDEECVKKHKSQHFKLVTNLLVKKIKSDTKRRKDLEDLLQENGVPHLTTTYEDLYYGDDASGWMDLFNFIGVGPKEGLTMEKVQSVFEFAKTSSMHHKDVLENYDEVKQLLTGTEFESLLH